MTQPTKVSFGASTFSDTGNTTEQIAAAWQTGDRILVFGGVSDGTAADQLATPTISGLTGTGLTFTLNTAVNNPGSGDAQVYLWTAVAAGNGSGSIDSASTSGSGLRNGIGVYVMRASSGLGTAVVLDGSTALTINLTRTGNNSHVLMMLVDFAQANDVVVTATPTGTVDFAEAEAGQADFFCVSFGDQGAAGGPTAYGIANHTGTVDMSGIVIEVFGSTSNATLTSPTPSGTLGTQFTATLGATTDQVSGTLYTVVDSAANLSGVTPTQIKAGQKASGSAALSSGNAAVASSTQTIPITGLTPGVLYSYATVQNNTNGDSNVVTGTFTTAAPPPTLLLGRRSQQFVTQEVIQS